MTALDDHKERNARTPDEILTAIDESGVESIYYQIVTLSGKLMAKVVPVTQLKRNLENGILMHRSAIADFQTALDGELLGGGPSAPEFNAMPDLDTFAVLPWDTSTARFLCTIYEPTHRPGIGGAPFAADPRGFLRRTHAQFKERLGLELRTGCEPEMTWFGEGLDVTSRPGSNPSYEFEQLERVRPIYQRIIRYATALGFEMIEGDYEDAGQLELNWMYDVADLTADRLVTYRMICRQVARELGVTASFMPKIAPGAMGTGCHHNLSLWKGGSNALEEPGRQELHLTDVGRWALGGLLEHAAPSMIVMGQTVNSYKRYWDAGQFAPTKINWGMEDKTCTVRLSGNGRLEYKLPDSAVNPYLSHALMLTQIEDGIANEIDPDRVTIQDIPKTLGDAVQLFTDDKFVRRSVTPEIANLLVAIKSDEWARFCGAVTDWERDMYFSAGQ
ncbi:glutamine synthetase family protein [Rhodococcus koreensis]